MNRVARHMRAMCDRAFETAETFGANIAVVAVDLGGHPVALIRSDQAGFATLEAARRKAVAGCTLQMSTAAAIKLFEGDPLVSVALSASGDLLLVPGGFQIVFDNRCVGGLGIAGGHYSEDELIGQRALAGAGHALGSKQEVPV